VHDQVTCPKCGNEFAVAEALRDQMQAQMRAQMKSELQAALDDAKARSEQELANLTADVDRQLAEARKRADDAGAKELEVLRKERELVNREANAAIALEQTLAGERTKLLEQAEETARVRLAAQAAQAEQARAQLEAELDAARKRAEDAALKEADLLRMRRELEERETSAALTLEQTLASERKKVIDQAEHAARARFELQARAEAERLAGESAIEVERIRREAQLARAQIESELVTAKKRADEAASKEMELLRKQRELDERETNAALELEQRLAAERSRVKLEAERAVEERLKVRSEAQLEEVRRESEARVERMNKDLADARAKADSAALKEVELLRKQQELDDAKRAIALETEKRLLEERKRFQELSDEQTTQRMALLQEQTRLREKEQEEKNAQLQRTVDQLQQRLSQGAQQAQGEAQELVLKDILVDAFEEDVIEDVAKGIRGADLVQRVRTPSREDCGVILWESKRTQGWSAGWLEKLRDDQREIGAVCAVIVTQALPPEIKNFGMVDGVWVCGWSYAGALGAALRAGIQDVHAARRSTAGRDTKMHLLYDYLVGHEFRQRVQGVIEAIVSMQEELGAEQRAFARIWKRRGISMNRALTQLGSVYGDLQGIVGAKLEDISPLALPAASPALASLDEHDTDDEELDGEDESDPNVPASPELESALFALVPADGSGIGNATLRSALAAKVGCSDAEFQAAKGALLAKGYVKKGKGRGGSVSRVVPASVSEVRSMVR
jgi:hypothetical protein